MATVIDLTAGEYSRPQPSKLVESLIDDYIEKRRKAKSKRAGQKDK
jgi:hypothetical protein